MKILWIVGSVFLVVGLGMLYGGFSFWRSNAAFAAHASSADGTVTDLAYSSSSKGKGTYRPVVEFTAPNGSKVHITGSGGSNPPAYARGDKVRVLFDPANPEQAKIDSFMEQSFGPLILGGMGAIFGLVGGGMVGFMVRRRKVRAWLAQNGMKVRAKFEGVEYDTSLKVNGRHPWRLTCQWQHPSTQNVYLFRSDPVWFDPTSFVNREELDVLVNADNPKQYEVDISFLPKQG
jgi:hypothetical protein